ncbi:Chemotaxis protein CheW [Planctomycetes bacterium Pan216]|uniref:Chemotaxis protein CheW n=1 Tax=Kolteria novifilia TaxID=2527975 RepID=A0A518B2D8_9BACT|nr:Chemotaxis protein CheW [Planctomycetes bacterium Pan216]
MNTPKETGRKPYCTFRLGRRLFGVDVLDVKEINTERELTPIHHAPDEVMGYVNLRGSIHLVLDMRLMLGMERLEIGPDTRLMVFKPSAGDSFGVMVDAIGDIVDVDEDLVEERRSRDEGLPEGAERRQLGADFVCGVCRLDEELLMVVNSRQLLPAIEKIMTMQGAATTTLSASPER